MGERQGSHRSVGGLAHANCRSGKIVACEWRSCGARCGLLPGALEMLPFTPAGKRPGLILSRSNFAGEENIALSALTKLREFKSGMDVLQCKLCVIGAARCGKTSICHALTGFPALPPNHTITKVRL